MRNGFLRLRDDIFIETAVEGEISGMLPGLGFRGNVGRGKVSNSFFEDVDSGGGGGLRLVRGLTSNFGEDNSNSISRAVSMDGEIPIFDCPRSIPLVSVHDFMSSTLALYCDVRSADQVDSTLSGCGMKGVSVSVSESELEAGLPLLGVMIDRTAVAIWPR